MSIGYTDLRKKGMALAVFLTLISQMPFFRTVLGIDTKLIAYPMWGVLLVFTFFPSFPRLRGKLQFIKTFCVLFSVGLILLNPFSEHGYFGSSEDTFLMPITISLVMLFVGYYNGKGFGLRECKSICYAYILSTLLLSVDVYINYLRGTSLSSVNYAFSAKNSVGQMIVTAIILLLFVGKTLGIKPLIKYGLVGFLGFALIMMRSRASIASLVLIPILYILSSKIRLRYRVLLTIALAGILIFILNDNAMYSLLIRNLLLNTTDNRTITFADMNRITSNRFEYFDLFKELIQGNEIAGIGAYYMDNMFLSAFLNFGFILGALVIMLAIYPVFVSYSKQIQLHPCIDMTIKSIAVTYFFNSFFEGLAPFGPGTKCFFLWLLLGIVLNSENQLQRNNFEGSEVS